MHREDYTMLNNNNLAYLDNAASSLTPDFVIDKMNDYYYSYRANIDRGLYSTAQRATYEYELARVKVANFVGAETDDIIFTSGSTDSSNKLIMMLEKYLSDKLSERDEIVISDHAHHSELVPLQELAKRNNLKIILTDNVIECITDRTLLVSHMLVSNVTGEIFDISETFRKAKSYGAFTICDLSSAVGHIRVNVKDLGVDAAYFSSHKMCGPTGVGALYLSRDISRNLDPITYGGGMVSTVSDHSSDYRSDVKRFEAGTANIAGVIGFGSACEYLSNIGLDNITEHTRELTTYAMAKLTELESDKVIRIFAQRVINKNIGIISFELYRSNGAVVHAHDVAQILADNNIAVRSGHHCAAPLINRSKVVSLTRASIYFYNTKTDIDLLVEAIVKVREIFK